jgi:hypothetical protein
MLGLSARNVRQVVVAGNFGKIVIAGYLGKIVVAGNFGKIVVAGNFGEIVIARYVNHLASVSAERSRGPGKRLDQTPHDWIMA